MNTVAEYEIDLTPEAREDLHYYSAFERKLAVSAIRAQLRHEPSTETTNRKELRPNPISTWELRAGKFRVFYNVDEEKKAVTVVSIGHKEHHRLLIRGTEARI
jgi:mRNA-degrading endonuclease RelE of RelBE toxin-antitoxin system